MSIALELTPAEEARLRREAKSHGLRPEALAHRIVVEHLPDSHTGPADPLIALLDAWDYEDASITVAEIDSERRQWEELKFNLNSERDRAGSRRLF